MVLRVEGYRSVEVALAPAALVGVLVLVPNVVLEVE